MVPEHSLGSARSSQADDHDDVQRLEDGLEQEAPTSLPTVMSPASPSTVEQTRSLVELGGFAQEGQASTPGAMPHASSPEDAEQTALAESGGLCPEDQEEKWKAALQELEALQQQVVRQQSRLNQQELEIRLLQAKLQKQQNSHAAQQSKPAAKPIAHPSGKHRPPAPATVPQHLWDKALDEAPRIRGQLRWVLRERSKFGLVHDSRVPQSFTARFAVAVPGLRCRKAHDGTDGSKEEHWRPGSCVRSHETLGKWYVQFDDSAQEEVIDCGFQDLYDTNPLPPSQRGSLEEATATDGEKVLRCRHPTSGGYYKDEAGEVIEIRVVPDLRVKTVREAFEAQCGHPNGLALITPGGRVLDPCEDLRRLDETFEASEEEIASEENRLILELFKVNDDGTQTLFWHSGTSFEKATEAVPSAAEG